MGRKAYAVPYRASAPSTANASQATSFLYLPDLIPLTVPQDSRYFLRIKIFLYSMRFRSTGVTAPVHRRQRSRMYKWWMMLLLTKTGPMPPPLSRKSSGSANTTTIQTTLTPLRRTLHSSLLVPINCPRPPRSFGYLSLVTSGSAHRLPASICVEDFCEFHRIPKGFGA